MNEIEAILARPDRVICTRLHANISRAQCARNQSQGRMDPWGPYGPCLKCNLPGKASKPAKPRIIRDNVGMPVKTREYRDAVGRGEEMVLDISRKTIQVLRDAAARLGWPQKRIDKYLKDINISSKTVQRLLIKEWASELGIR